MEVGDSFLSESRILKSGKTKKGETEEEAQLAKD
jgi:hypothetical protein